MTPVKCGLKIGLIAPALAVGLLASGPASAAGLTGLAAAGNVDAAMKSNVIQVRSNRRGPGRRFKPGRGYNNNHAYNRRKARRRKRRNLALGIGLGIFGAAILANRNYDRTRYYNKPVRTYGGGYGGGGYRAAKRRCARVFEDYSWRTDLVYDDYGDERLCPFVRRYY